jgi:hypothetical protein
VRAKFSPIREDSGKRDSGFIGAELQKTVPRSPREGILQTLRKLGLKSRGIAILDQGEVAVRS